LNGELRDADFVALVADPLGNHTAGTLDLLLWGPLMIAGALMMLQKRRSMVRILLLVQIRPRSHCVVLRVALWSFDLIHVQPYHLRNASWVSSNDTLTLMLYLIWCLANLSGHSHLRSGRRCTLVCKSVPWCVGGMEIARSKGDLVTGGFRWKLLLVLVSWSMILLHLSAMNKDLIMLALDLELLLGMGLGLMLLLPSDNGLLLKLSTLITLAINCLRQVLSTYEPLGLLLLAMVPIL